MRSTAAANAHSRNVLALDVEAVGLGVRHGERFWPLECVWEGYRDRGSWCTAGQSVVMIEIAALSVAPKFEASCNMARAFLACKSEWEGLALSNTKVRE